MNNNFLLGQGARQLPLCIHEYDDDPTVDCVLCLYGEDGTMRDNAKGVQWIKDALAHVQSRQHRGRVQRGGMQWAHVQRMGMQGTSFQPSPVTHLYRCLACSLDKVGVPKLRHWNMPYHAMMAHATTGKHLERCGDQRQAIHAAGGLAWAVPVVAAPVLVMAVQPLVVVAPVPVVVPAVPVVVPRQPQP